MAGEPQVTRSTPPHILVIGSGAVGAAYARYLVRGGCLVTFLARSRNSNNARMPRNLYRYALLGGPQAERQNLPVLTDAGAGHFDQVWLCLPSTALQGSWLGEQLQKLRGTPPLVAWTPDVADIDTLRGLYRGDIAQGLIGLISFQTPLPGEQHPGAGIGFYAPPRSAVLDDSAPGRRAAGLLRAGGLSATVSKDLPWLEGRLAAATICAVAGLEQAQWSLRGLRQSALLPLAVQAGIQATGVTAHYLGRPAPGGAALLRRLALHTILGLGPRVMPFDLENYLHYHFAKVGDQTRQIIQAWVARGQQAGLPTDALAQLLDGLMALDGARQQPAA